MRVVACDLDARSERRQTSAFLRKAPRSESRRSRARLTRQRCVVGHTHTLTHIAVCALWFQHVCVVCARVFHASSVMIVTEWRGSPPSFCRRHPVAWRAQISSRYRRPRGRADMVLKVLLRGAWRRNRGAREIRTLFLHFNRRWERGRNERGVRQRKREGEEGQGKWEGGRGKVRREERRR